MQADNGMAKKIAAIAAVPLAVILGAGSAEAITSSDVRSLTYLQVGPCISSSWYCFCNEICSKRCRNFHTYILLDAAMARRKAVLFFFLLWTPLTLRCFLQIKGTGLANRCPEVSEANSGGTIQFDEGKKYKLVEMCLEPKSFQIEEETTKRRGEVKKGE